MFFFSLSYIRTNLKGVVVIDGNIFCHAGLNPYFAKLGVDYINRAVSLLLEIPMRRDEIWEVF